MREQGAPHQVAAEEERDQARWPGLSCHCLKDGRKLGVRHERSEPYLARQEAHLATTQAEDFKKQWWDFYHAWRAGRTTEEYSSEVRVLWWWWW